MNTAERIVAIIKDQGLVHGMIQSDKFMAPNGEKPTFYFNLRPLFMDATFLTLVSEHFWSQFNPKEVYVGGLETAAIPLVAGLIAQGGDDAKGFYIRKKRKDYNEMNLIDGIVDSSRKVVLVDDLINSGGSFQKQISILEDAGCSVSAVFPIVQFRPTDSYTQLAEQDISIVPVSTLEDYNLPLVGPSEHNYFDVQKPTQIFAHVRPHYFESNVSVNPSLQSGVAYTTGDSGSVHAVDMKTGDVCWHKRLVLWPDKRRRTFVSLKLVDAVLYATTYYGKTFVLSLEGTVEQIVKSNVDTVVDMDVVMAENGPVLIVAGTFAYGRQQKKEGLVVQSVETGEVLWQTELDEPLQAPVVTHASGRFIAVTKTGVVSVYDAMTGKVIKQKKLRVTVSCVQQLLNRLCIGTEDGRIVQLELDSLRVLATNQCGDQAIQSIASTQADVLYCGTADMRVLAFDYRKNEVLWRSSVRGQMFGAPLIYGNSLFCGTAEGGIYKVNLTNGLFQGKYFVAERIITPLQAHNNQLVIHTITQQLFTAPLESLDSESDRKQP